MSKLPVPIFVGFVLLGSRFALSAPAPVLDVDGLVRSADLVVVGSFGSLSQVGSTAVRFGGGAVAARAMSGDLRVQQVLKGTVGTSDVVVAYADPAASIGYQGVATETRTYFLVKGTSAYEFASPYHRSIAAEPGYLAEGATDADRVASALAGVLHATDAPLQAKVEAINDLSSMQGMAAGDVLEAAITDDAPEVRTRAAGALVGRGDLAGLPLVEGALLQNPAQMSSEVLHNLRSAVADGIRDEQALSDLQQLLVSGDAETRRAAVSALAHIGSPSVIPTLARTLGDSDTLVQQRVVAALAYITGQRDETTTIAEFPITGQAYVAYWQAWARARGLIK